MFSGAQVGSRGAPDSPGYVVRRLLNEGPKLLGQVRMRRWQNGVGEVRRKQLVRTEFLQDLCCQPG